MHPETWPKAIKNVIRAVIAWTDAPATQKWIARTALLVAIVAAIASVGHLDDRVSLNDAGKDPSVARIIVDQGALLAGLRLVFLFGALFIVFSVAARIWNAHWLTKFGPAEVVGEQVPALLEEASKKDKALRKAENRIKKLGNDLAENQAALDQSATALRAALAQLDRA